MHYIISNSCRFNYLEEGASISVLAREDALKRIAWRYFGNSYVNQFLQGKKAITLKMRKTAIFTVRHCIPNVLFFGRVMHHNVPFHTSHTSSLLNRRLSRLSYCTYRIINQQSNYIKIIKSQFQLSKIYTTHSRVENEDNTPAAIFFTTSEIRMVVVIVLAIKSLLLSYTVLWEREGQFPYKYN